MTLSILYSPIELRSDLLGFAGGQAVHVGDRGLLDTRAIGHALRSLLLHGAVALVAGDAALVAFRCQTRHGARALLLAGEGINVAASEMPGGGDSGDSAGDSECQGTMLHGKSPRTHDGVEIIIELLQNCSIIQL